MTVPNISSSELSIPVRLQRLIDACQKKGLSGRVSKIENGVIRGFEVESLHLLASATVEDVTETEQRLGVVLPTEFRSFLLNVSNGGPGPGHGLYSLSQLENALRSTPMDPFLGSEPAGLADPKWSNDEFENYVRIRLQGTLPVAANGSTGEYVLIANGPHRGEVWQEDFGCDRGIWPASSSFLEFYFYWLRSIEQIIGIG